MNVVKISLKLQYLVVNFMMIITWLINVSNPQIILFVPFQIICHSNNGITKLKYILHIYYDFMIYIYIIHILYIYIYHMYNQWPIETIMQWIFNEKHTDILKKLFYWFQVYFNICLFTICLVYITSFKLFRTGKECTMLNHPLRVGEYIQRNSMWNFQFLY